MLFQKLCKTYLPLQNHSCPWSTRLPGMRPCLSDAEGWWLVLTEKSPDQHAVSTKLLPHHKNSLQLLSSYYNLPEVGRSRNTYYLLLSCHHCRCCSHRLPPQTCSVSAIWRCCFHAGQVDGWRSLGSCSGVEQWVITRVRKRTRGMLTWHPLFPAHFELVVNRSCWWVVWRWRRGQWRMKGHKRVQFCKHGFCSGSAVNAASSRLPHCQERAFIPKSLIRKEFVRILQRKKKQSKKK